MRSVAITCDSACDLSEALIQRFSIRAVLPLYVRFGDDMYRDGVDINAKLLFSRVAETHQLPQTASVSVDDYIQVFRPLVEAGQDVIHISISSECSSCYQNARLAASELGDHVYPIDSRSLSTGDAYLMSAASEMAAAGMAASEIAEKLIEMTGRIETSFIIDTLDYLHKGGRCSAITALGANLLHLKPSVQLQDGKMHLSRKYRGRLAKAYCDYVTDRLQGRTDLDLRRAFITHAYAPQEVIDCVRQKILELQPFEELLETYTGSSVASHCGPNCLGLLLLRKPN